MSTAANISGIGTRETLGASANGVSAALFVAGLAGLGLGAVGGFFGGHAESFWRGYITGFIYVLTIALGSLFFVLLQHLTRAGWSVTVRRVAEIFTTSFPILALLSIPILVAMWMAWNGSGVMLDIYPWTNQAEVLKDKVLTHKQPYLNMTFFTARFVFYFLVWNAVAGFLRGNSLEQDRSGDERLSLKMLRWSPLSMLLFALTLTFCAFDLLMSLEPKWFSTIFGVYVFAGCVVSFHATMALTLLTLQSLGRLKSTISEEHYHDVGKMLFGFMVFWTYIAFSQYMLIWGANLPEETFWFKIRETEPWRTLSVVLLVGHFAVPFLLLISRFTKRRPVLLAVMATWMLVMHLVDMVYLVLPRLKHGSTDVAPLETMDLLMVLAGVIGVGGLCAAVVIRRMTTISLVPTHDPRLSESIAFENV